LESSASSVIPSLIIVSSLEAIITEASHNTHLHTRKRIGRRCRW
jgi:hypothetical protein